MTHCRQALFFSVFVNHLWQHFELQFQYLLLYVAHWDPFLSALCFCLRVCLWLTSNVHLTSRVGTIYLKMRIHELKNLKKEMKTMEASLLGAAKRAQVLYEKLIFLIHFFSFSFSFCYTGIWRQVLVEEIICASTSMFMWPFKPFSIRNSNQFKCPIPNTPKFIFLIVRIIGFISKISLHI